MKRFRMINVYVVHVLTVFFL